MTVACCPREAEVLAALDSGRWGEGLLEHRNSCPTCDEVSTVAAMLRHMAEAEATEELPDPGHIWWRARLEARSRAARKATRAITLVQGLTAACCLGFSAFGLGWLWPHFKRWFGAIDLAVLIPSTSSGPGEPGLIVVTCAGVLALIVFTNLYSTWADE